MNQKPNMPDQKNFFLAIVLSMAIIFGWQFFFAKPLPKPVEQAVQQQNGQVPAAPGASVVIDREKALAASKRLVIDTPQFIGSINLAGAQIDDLKLKNYRETAEASSPIITFLFSKIGVGHA